MILHQLFCHSDWGAFCNVKICGSRIKQLLQHWLHWQPFYKWNKHLIIRCEILDLTLFSTKDVGIKRAYILADFWHQPCVNSLQLFFFFFLCHWQCPARGVHVFYEPRILAEKNKSLPTFWQAPSVYRAILEKTHRGQMKTSGDTVPATSANV